MSSTAAQFEAGYGTCDQVTPQCPVTQTVYGAYFNLGGHAFFTVVFGLCTILHLALGIRYKTWGFSIWVTIGTLLELLGYAARCGMVANPWSLELFSMQFCTLIWGPTCIAAGISVVFKHIVNYVGPEHSVVKPKWIPWIFVGSDVVALILQGIGGIVASVGTGESGSNLLDAGGNMIIAGVAFQVANMVFCGGLALVFLFRYKRSKSSRGANTAPTTELEKDRLSNPQAARRFVVFSWAMGLATIAILVRCIYRVPEMAEGWANDIMRDEASFLICDGAMIAFATIVLVFVHPGIFFPRVRKDKKGAERAAVDPEEKRGSDSEGTLVGENATIEGQKEKP